MDKIIELPLWQEPKDVEEAKVRILNFGTTIHEHVYLIGKDLIWVRDKIGTTEFLNEWIPNNVWFSDRTAYHFMGFAKKCHRLKQLLEYHPKKQLPGGDETVALAGQYQTIIIDPPWPVEKIERYEAPHQEPNVDYKTMTIEAIKAIKLPTADDCHLFLWTTQKFLPTAFEVLKEWEFKYVLTMVWHKGGGFQPFNLPQYNCEFVLYGRKGSPTFTNTKDFFCCFVGKRREHSRKPIEFYNIIRRVTPEPRIDIFGREGIAGFEAWGDEIEKFQ
ncbi:MAG: MT-A70 family methyltransferase [Candidatus Bathyarchaeia archaeon]